MRRQGGCALPLAYPVCTTVCSCSWRREVQTTAQHFLELARLRSESNARRLDVIVLAAFAFVALQKELALQPMKLRLPGSLSMLAHKGECLIHRAQTLGDFPRAQTCISELGDRTTEPK